ncbi:uncharacterized protein LOC111349056 [Spodoptera litura]|uniref:Uncharacterized protein LOC111349056 n=1 Tax=Spodoptera litura TaxID=69820 RepID=A0A9J7IHW4_SPOLT|nr:uncharacterized protein LOC111349056 [Spodoptera litura]
MDDSNSEEDDLSDSDSLNKYQQKDEKTQGKNVDVSNTNTEEIRNVSKRKEREDDNCTEDEFITVVRRKPKRLIRSDSTEMQDKTGIDSNKTDNSQLEEVNKYQLCITSIETLPKQMALAKLLRSENIKGITRIKYKSFNKVLIQLSEDEEVVKLLECQKLKDMGLRCQKVNELTLSYGIVKGVDIDLNEKELLDVIECSTEIISINRLKRINTEGKWIDSEVVRISFKGSLPSYIYAYGCRFKVESYVFPVTQCSGCWQFGHILKFCPTKKKLCPKCGNNHENCDITEFKCLNCKGPHFTLDKTCPLYLKEKQIRLIMSKQQIPYRTALKVFLDKRENIENPPQNSYNYINLNTTRDTPTYSSILTRATVHRDSEPMETSPMDSVDKASMSRPVVRENRKYRINKRPTEVTHSLPEQERNEEIRTKERDKNNKQEEHTRTNEVLQNLEDSPGFVSMEVEEQRFLDKLESSLIV